ncbi:hypothetical protein TCAL_04320 [Tigriopus californicus]|uniref:DUF19 domain-containing protein n=1 Tax=Tigriopus californicus TaxID=6832 RepID=A0A553PT27_TIGCA|nr:uncharacterized protein LOC131891818 isoform X1 [Tigriopus californicus]TRY80830.1 hypothetical protein TCAL_04320 [Tigriopus californicus]|eukprot:TCALIF_04320-PA protein Name:"Protein of unknown function" AED:0.00 eAED:0.00 QI:71/1/1/1/0.8/0.83/6/76/370
MNKNYKTWLVLICSVQLVRGDCNATDELHRCFQGVQNVFLKPNFIFPTSQDEIDQSCSETFPKMWSEFVSCVTNFTETCFKGPEKAQIHQAVGKSINSIHKLCTNKDMQADYHNVSTCLRNKISENSQCGIPYQKFVQDANQGYEHLCCSYDEFKSCLLDGNKPCCDGPECEELRFSSELAKSWLEQAFGFMFKHCQDLSYCQPSTTSTTTTTTKTTPLLPQRTTQSYAYYPVSQDEEPNDDSDGDDDASDLETSTLPKNTIVTTETSTAEEEEDVGGVEDYGDLSATKASLPTIQSASRPTFRAPPGQFQEPRSLDERLNLLSDVTPVPRSASSPSSSPSSAGSSSKSPPTFRAFSLLLHLLIWFWGRA